MSELDTSIELACFLSCEGEGEGEGTFNTAVMSNDLMSAREYLQSPEITFRHSFHVRGPRAPGLRLNTILQDDDEEEEVEEEEEEGE